MKEDDCVIEAPKETSVCIDDNYRAKLKAVRQGRIVNTKNTVNMAKQEKVEELRAGDFIGYYYKPVFIIATTHCIVRSCWGQKGVLRDACPGHSQTGWRASPRARKRPRVRIWGWDEM